MKEYLHLFTPTADAKLEGEQGYIVGIDCGFGKMKFRLAWYDKRGFFSDFEEQHITHVLDLSKLTTKEKLKQHLPEDCIQGHGKVKFCTYRQGDGNECKHCS